MNLKTKHAETLEQLLLAIGQGEKQTVRDIVFDQSIGLHEAIYLVAAAAEDNAAIQFARLLLDGFEQLWDEKKSLDRKITNGGLNEVVQELSTRDRPTACCFVVLLCDWNDKTANSFMERMEYLHANPERMGL